MTSRTITISGKTFEVELGTTPHDDLHWSWVDQGLWEKDTFEFINSYVDSNTLFIDVGAHIGMVSLYASALAGRVVSVEPDRAALRALKANISLNNITNIEIIEKAVGDGERLPLFSKELGNSMSNLMGGGELQSEVETISLTEIVGHRAGTEKLFVKVDIEGFEERIARQLNDMSRKEDVVLLLSLHKQLETVSDDYIDIVSSGLVGFQYFMCEGKAVDLEWIRANGDDHVVLCVGKAL